MIKFFNNFKNAIKDLVKKANIKKKKWGSTHPAFFPPGGGIDMDVIYLIVIFLLNSR